MPPHAAVARWAVARSHAVISFKYVATAACIVATVVAVNGLSRMLNANGTAMSR